MRFPKHNVLLGILGIVFLVGVFFVFGIVASNLSDKSDQKEDVSEQGEPQVHEVVLSDEGYKPRTLTIRRGDIVRFTTARNGPHWPASNLHPTHTIYSVFDPKRPLASDEGWSFTFERIGEWGFHDHLRAQFTGIVRVIE